MATRGRKGSVLLSDSAGLNFGIWLDPTADVETSRPQAVRSGKPSEHQAPELSLTQQMEEVRKDWEHTLNGKPQARRSP
jgi:hypothetical protein